MNVYQAKQIIHTTSCAFCEIVVDWRGSNRRNSSPILDGPDISETLSLCSKLSVLGRELCEDVRDLLETRRCSLSLSCFKLSISVFKEKSTYYYYDCFFLEDQPWKDVLQWAYEWNPFWPASCWRSPWETPADERTTTPPNGCRSEPYPFLVTVCAILRPSLEQTHRPPYHRC